jgi:hypothetical protein
LQLLPQLLPVVQRTTLHAVVAMLAEAELTEDVKVLQRPTPQLLPQLQTTFAMVVMEQAFATDRQQV